MSNRGFASLTPERRKEIASQGGKSMKKENRSFFRNRELAVAAGKKGGLSVKPENRSFSKDPKLASRAGRARRLAQ